MNKKSLSERDICTKFITPALAKAGWDVAAQVREEFTLTKGRILARGKLHTRGKAKRADYVLFYKPGIPLAVIEAKDKTHSVGSGMPQALGYRELLQVPFAFSSNGDSFLFHNALAQSGPMETELALDAFPTPEALWQLWATHRGLNEQETAIVTQDYYSDGSNKAPRYYQLLAINNTLEAIAKGQNRVLLVMATGTGKTFTAFQIIWRLWKAKAKKRILFLADRNILVDQTKTGDFAPFGSAMTKIQKRQANKSYEIYLSLYQAVSGPEEEQNIYKQFSPDFFDLIVVDECHRGSATENAAWRKILDYFSSATQIGLTATPKETEDASNSAYFGNSVYTYSLRQGIEDGFLAPYTVVRYDLDKDLFGWRPSKGMVDKYDNLIVDRIYNLKDIDRSLVLEARTELIAKQISDFLRQTNRFDKTIVFCDNIDHAERMRQALVNENSDLASQHPRYVVRITGDSQEADSDLYDFCDLDSKFPVIATTSKLMTTGIDAKTCKLIVLDQHIQSMTEFKQIIGRGTRLFEDSGKFSFTIMDFKKATELFADPAFDGDPVRIYTPKPGESPVPPEDTPDEGAEGPHGDLPTPEGTPFGEGEGPGEGEEDGPKRFVLTKHNVQVTLVARRVQYIDAQGKLVTESVREYTRKTVLREFASLDDFLLQWRGAQRKEAIIQELEEQGIFFAALEAEVGKPLDPFDLICHVAYGMPPLTRKERAEQVKKRNYFAKYGETARAVLYALLDKYADVGIEHIESTKVLTVMPFTEMGTPIELVRQFGGKEQYLAALQELEEHLYAS